MSALIELYNEVALCRRCDLYRNATHPVPGTGPENAEIMFIGEGPGYHEDQEGKPFVGPAGKFLDQLLASVNLKRDQVYIANVVKHRPPNNREPLPSEISACSVWLDRQLEIIHPKIIVTLGRHSMGRFFPNKSISRIHGTGEKRDGVVYFAMYHPAAALHQQSLKAEIERDMLKIPALLKELQPPPPAPPEKPRQMSLF
jgi:uracil-DNA glycosylase family 4